MSNSKPYFITDESPSRLRKLLIKNPFLPMLHDNLHAGRELNDSIFGLENDDPVIDFILSQLAAHDIIDKNSNGYSTKYSRLVPPQRWSEEEHLAYIESVLSYINAILAKGPRGMVSLGHYTGSTTNAQLLAHAEKQAVLNDSLINIPDGPIKFQVVTLIKQL